MAEAIQSQEYKDYDITLIRRETHAWDFTEIMT